MSYNYVPNFTHEKCVLFQLCVLLNLVYMPYNIVLVLYKIDSIFSE